MHPDQHDEAAFDSGVLFSLPQLTPEELAGATFQTWKPRRVTDLFVPGENSLTVEDCVYWQIALIEKALTDPTAVNDLVASARPHADLEGNAFESLIRSTRLVAYLHDLAHSQLIDAGLPPMLIRREYAAGTPSKRKNIDVVAEPLHPDPQHPAEVQRIFISNKAPLKNISKNLANHASAVIGDAVHLRENVSPLAVSGHLEILYLREPAPNTRCELAYRKLTADSIGCRLRDAIVRSPALGGVPTVAQHDAIGVIIVDPARDPSLGSPRITRLDELVAEGFLSSSAAARYAITQEGLDLISADRFIPRLLDVHAHRFPHAAFRPETGDPGNRG